MPNRRVGSLWLGMGDRDNRGTDVLESSDHNAFALPHRYGCAN